MSQEPSASYYSPHTDEETDAGFSEYEPLLRETWNKKGHRERRIDTLAHGSTSSNATLLRYEFWTLLRRTIPVALAYILQNSLQTMCIFMVSQASNSPHDLSIAAFSYFFAASTGWLIGIGGSTALDTLASSTYTGSENKHDLGILLQRAFFVLTIFYLPITILWIFSEHVFLALGQSPELSRDSAWFLTCLIPGGLGYIYLEIMKKYLQAQGIMQPGTYILIITSPISALLNYQFVATWGIFAAPFATGIGYWLSFLGLLAYTKFMVGTEHWGGWSWKCFHNLGIFSRLAFLGIVQAGTEWLAYEVTALAAGRLGKVALASQSIILTAAELLCTVPLGVGVVTTARVGNFLGMRDISSARRSSAISVLIGVMTCSIILITLMSTRSIFAKLFTTDKSVVKLTAQTLPFVAFSLVSDGVTQSTGGILRAMGRQHLGAFINIVGYYCIGLPLGLLLAFKSEWGLCGIWTGTFVGLSSVGAVQLAVVAFSDWQAQVEGVFSRMDQAVSAGDAEDPEISAAETATVREV